MVAFAFVLGMVFGALCGWAAALRIMERPVLQLAEKYKHAKYRLDVEGLETSALLLNITAKHQLKDQAAPLKVASTDIPQISSSHSGM